MSTDANIASLFWAAALNAANQSGPTRIPFDDFWPRGKELQKQIKAYRELENGTTFLRKLAIFVTRTRVWHVLEALIDLGAISVSVRCTSGRSLLHLACVLDSPEGVRLLLTKDASTLACDDAGELPSSYTRDSEVMKLLFAGMKQQQHSKNKSIPAAVINSSSATTSASHGHLKKSPSTITDDNIKNTEIETIFSMVKSSNKMFPFEEIVMKIKGVVPDVLTAVDDSSRDTLLHAAVRVGLVAVPLIVLIVHYYKTNANALNGHGETPLIVAIRQGWLSIADLLIVCCEADVNKPGTDGLAPIHVACFIDFPDAVLHLLRRGATISSANGKFSEDLAEVGASCRAIVRKANADRLNRILNACAETAITTTSSAVTLAIGSRNSSAQFNGITLCIGDFELRNSDGETLLTSQKALLNPAFMSAALHVLSNSRIDVEWRSKIVNARHATSGRTALSIAARLGSVEVVRSLMAMNALPSIADKDNLLPVHHALMCGDLAVVSTLYDSDSGLIGFEHSFHLVANRQEAMAVVREAFVRRQERIVRPLLRDAALRRSVDGLAEKLEPSDLMDVSTVSRDMTEGMTESPLFLAVKNGALQVVKFFIERGANVRREQAVTGDCLLHVAVRYYNADISMIEFLLGLDKRRDFLEHLNCSGQSALHVAAQHGLEGVVDRLIAAGASPLLDEAAGFPPVSSTYQSIQLRLDKVRRNRSATVFEMLKSCAPEKEALKESTGKKETESLIKKATRQNTANRYLNAATNLLASFSANGPAGSRPSKSVATGHQKEGGSKTRSDTTTLEHVRSSQTLRRRLSTELPSLVQIYDFYLFDFNGEPLLTAAVRQKNFTLIEQLVLFYKQAADEFNHAAMRRTTAFEIGSKEQDAFPRTSAAFSFSNTISPKRTELMHPCLLRSPRNGATVLHVAVQLYDSRRLVALLAGACEGSLTVTDSKGLNPLQLAVTLSRRRAVSVLVKYPTANLDIRTIDGRTLEELASRTRIRASLQHARQRRSRLQSGENLDDDNDELLSSTSTTASTATWNQRRPGDNESLSSVSMDEDIESAGRRDGLSKKQLKVLSKRLDFVGVIEKYKDIQRKFASETLATAANQRPV